MGGESPAPEATSTSEPDAGVTSTSVPDTDVTATSTVESTPTESPSPTAEPTSSATPSATEAVPEETTTAVATVAPTQTATAVAEPDPTQTPPELTLDLLSPEDGTGVEIGALRVMGKTRVDAVVGVNGVPVDVFAGGSFQQDVALEEGVNLIEVTASALTGETVSQQVAVFFVSTAAGLPFTLLYPPDGLVVTDPTVMVTGGTRPDAVVGVNGVPVDVNSLGIFSTSVSLDEGGNFIEVLATDIDGNVRFQTVAVFYLP